MNQAQKEKMKAQIIEDEEEDESLKEVKYLFAQYSGDQRRRHGNAQHLDEFLITTIDKYELFALFDGHGQMGRYASQQVSQFIAEYFDNNSTLIENMKNVEEQRLFVSDSVIYAYDRLRYSVLDYSSSGCCLIICVVINQNLHVASLGNAKCVLINENTEKHYSNIKAIELSTTHDLKNQQEYERILKNKGKVSKFQEQEQHTYFINKYSKERYRYLPLRIYFENDDGPGLTSTRSLGDFNAQKIGCIADPDVVTYSLSNMDKFIFLASDGLLDLLRTSKI